MGLTELFIRSLSPWTLTTIPLVFVVVLASTHTVIRLYDEHIRLRAPRVGKNPWIWGLWRSRAYFARNSKDLTHYGYDAYKDSIYRIQTGDMERLVVANSYLNELRKLPDTRLSSKVAVVERNLGWYNGVDIILKSTSHVDVCRVQLVQNLGRVVDGLVAELDNVFRLELTACFEDRADFYNASKTILHIVNRSIAKTIVGEPLCDRDEWLSTSLKTTVNTGMLTDRLRKLPVLVRPLVSPYTASGKALKEGLEVARRLLSEEITENRRRGGERTDILQWLIDRHDADDVGIQFLTNQVLFITTAATRSTAASIVHTTFDLLAYPQYQNILRHDIEDALMRSGGWSLEALHGMERLDSFIKESQRLNHHPLLSFNRKVQSSITLKDGLTIPAGTFISVPSYWAARDPDIHLNGSEFHPWYWFDLRSTSPTNLYWGYGRNECPGRFMAAVEIKLLVAWMLRNFDVTFPPGQTGRPENLFVDERVRPCPTQEVGFRRLR
ncbi:cytochrome P450 [Durotheca rogersii]|uniref:cytochrome P450 n=1 Tax=Durotheca rogersii TaxID=419775 RepID=UPI00221F34F4|nr:cytochrome P450 [Durotheca rogersii]KAI5860763.1 cytochrome P450 [Durotheca rogersii]